MACILAQQARDSQVDSFKCCDGANLYLSGKQASGVVQRKSVKKIGVSKVSARVNFLFTFRANFCSHFKSNTFAIRIIVDRKQEKLTQFEKKL